VQQPDLDLKNVRLFSVASYNNMNIISLEQWTGTADTEIPTLISLNSIFFWHYSLFQEMSRPGNFTFYISRLLTGLLWTLIEAQVRLCMFVLLSHMFLYDYLYF